MITHIIQQIVDLDKQVVAEKKQTEEAVRALGNQTTEHIHNSENTTLTEAKNTGQKQYEEAMSLATEARDTIYKNCDAECSALLDAYNAVKAQTAKAVIAKLLG